MADRLIVVGGGMAAVRLVEGLVGSRWEVTVLSEEDDPPYNRILLSAVLEGAHAPDALTLRSEAWFADHGVDLRLGVRVAEIDRAACEVVLVDGARVPYDRLVLATGAIPTLPPVRGLVRPDGTLHPAVHPFRSLTDCRGLDAALAGLVEEGRSPVAPLVEEGRSPVAPSVEEGRSPVAPLVEEGRSPVTRPRAAVVGGGLLGLQVARALAVRGVLTEVVEGGEHLLASQVDPAAGRILARDLRRLGTEVYTGSRAVRLDPRADGGAGLRLDNGHVLEVDLVVLTAGGRPSTALARRAGLMVRRGVVVDSTLTSVTDPRIHAIGDCASHRGRVSGFVPPAWEQAGVLAARLRGDPASYDGSRNVARLRATGLEVAVLGEPTRASGQVVEMSNPMTGSHRRLVVDGGRIVAATLVGDLSRVGLITQFYDHGTLLGAVEPGALLAPESASSGSGPDTAGEDELRDDAEVCACAGVTAGAVRACASYDDCLAVTRATTGCGGCASLVRSLLGPQGGGAQGGVARGEAARDGGAQGREAGRRVEGSAAAASARHSGP